MDEATLRIIVKDGQSDDLETMTTDVIRQANRLHNECVDASLTFAGAVSAIVELAKVANRISTRNEHGRSARGEEETHQEAGRDEPHSFTGC